jgi:invasion protein IalB
LRPWCGKLRQIGAANNSCRLNGAALGRQNVPENRALVDRPSLVSETIRTMRGAPIRRRFDRVLIWAKRLGGLGALIATLLAVPALAQGTVRAEYGDWQMSCDTPPGASAEQCAIIQNVLAEDQPNVGLSVIVLRTADREARLLRVLAPLGVLLPNGLGLNVDGTDMGRVAFVRCLPNGCIAEVELDDDLIKVLSDGTSAIFVVFKTPEEGVGIPVSMEGFSEGFAALP